MKTLTRRTFLATTAAAAQAGAANAKLRIGTMDGVFKMQTNPEAVALAKKVGLAGVQVTLGRPKAGESTMSLENRELQKAWVAASKQHDVPLNSTYLDVLHQDCLKDSDAAMTWVRKGITVTKNLGAPVLMMVFFGKCQVLQRRELDRVVGLSRELAAEAEKAGVILGFENTSSGADNRYAVDEVNSKAFKCWYDIGNSTYNGFDVPAEIQMLGRDRICMFHIKDKGYLGEGKVDVAGALKAIRDIKFDGYGNLETGSPSGDVEADARRNLAYASKLI
jgi:sugar phosphate isomerase/epimerase